MILMKRRIAIVGAGVSGLTCGVLFAERGYRTAIFAKETGQQTTSGAAAALWFPYDAEPAEDVAPATAARRRSSEAEDGEDTVEWIAIPGSRCWPTTHWGRRLRAGHGLGIAVHRSFLRYVASVVEAARRSARGRGRARRAHRSRQRCAARSSPRRANASASCPSVSS